MEVVILRLRHFFFQNLERFHNLMADNHLLTVISWEEGTGWFLKIPVLLLGTLPANHSPTKGPSYSHSYDTSISYDALSAMALKVILNLKIGGIESLSIAQLWPSCKFWFWTLCVSWCVKYCATIQLIQLPSHSNLGLLIMKSLCTASLLVH